MKMSDLSDLNEDGRIVKGVNTTPDVSTDEIKTQAAKFGFNVDKDGRPPTLSKKVKGKSTNVLFNLGLAEGYKLQLERDKQMLVLNIKNTTTGQRTEVRGKPGYETGNYDPDDDLHQLLDTIGKSVDISQLMNGEPVGINPKHPDSAKAKAATDKAYSEERYTAMEWACIEGGHCLEDIQPKKRSDLFAQMENFANDEEISKAKERTKELYAVQKAIDDIYDDPNWRERRDELKKLIRRESELEKRMQLVRPGNTHRYDHDSLGRKISDPKNYRENFADGKKKGKSRPGRVKKSGASCNGSVTDLRKRAKKASGEKAKMYHWCANMKSGRKKK